jgi:flagellin
MTVSTIATIAAGLTRTLGNSSAKSTNIFNNLLAASPRTNASVTDSSAITAAIGLQNQIAQFRVASRDVAQAGALLSTAESGANQITQRLERLRDLAARAAEPSATAEERVQLNQEFQNIRQQIDQTALNTRFGNENLLDGSSAQLKIANESGEQKNLSVGSLTSATLFKGTNPDISTASGAKVAQTTVKAAIDYAQAQVAHNRRALAHSIPVLAYRSPH